MSYVIKTTQCKMRNCTYRVRSWNKTGICSRCRYSIEGKLYLLKQYYKDKPIPLCKCGCGKLIPALGKKYRQNHNPKVHAIGWHQTEYQKQCARRAQLGRSKTEQQRKLQSLAMKGKMKGEKNPFYGKTHNKSTLRKIGLKLKGRESTFLGLHHTEMSKKLLSISTSSRLQAGWFPYKKHLYEHTRRYIAMWMRSSWEVAFAEYLDDLEVNWVYEPKSFILSCGGYTPDFYVPKWKTYVEIKGAKWKMSMMKVKHFPKETKMKLLLLDQDKLIKMGVLI